jgi:hypothetical protein
MVMFALSMSVFLGALIVGVARFSLAYDKDVLANQAAMAAVRGGASQVDLRALQSDVVQLRPDYALTLTEPGDPKSNQTSALWTCTQVALEIGGSGTSVTCSQSGNELTARVKIPVNLPFGAAAVTVTYSGCPVEGFGGAVEGVSNCLGT